MTVFNTGNPVPSSDGRDLNDNALTIDQIVNGNGVVTNRVGQQLNTLKSLEEAYILTAINNGIWASGQQFTGYNQFMVFSGTAYKVKFSTPVPHTVGAAPDFDFVEPVTITIGSGLTSFNLVSEMVADTTLAVGNKIITYKYNSFVMNFWEIAASGNVLIGDIFLDNSLFAVLKIESVMTPRHFGSTGDGIVVETSSFQRMALANAPQNIGYSTDTYLITDQVLMPNNFKYRGNGSKIDWNGVAGAITVQGRDWGVFQAIGTQGATIDSFVLTSTLVEFAESSYPIGNDAAFAGREDTYMLISAGTLTAPTSPSFSLMTKFIQLNGTTQCLIDYRNGWDIEIGKTINYKELTPVFGIELEDILIEDKSPFSATTSDYASGISLGFAYNCHFKNVRAIGFRNPIIFAQWTVDCTVDGGKLEKPQETGGGQGYYVQWNNVLRCDTKNVTTYSSRHIVDHTQSAYCNVENCRDSNSLDGAFTNHGAYEHDISYQNCVGFHSVANSGAAFGESAKRITIINGNGRKLDADRNVIDLTVINSRFSFVTVNSQGFQAQGLTVNDDGALTGFSMRSTTTALGRTTLSNRKNILDGCKIVLNNNFFLSDNNFVGRTLYMNDCDVITRITNPILAGTVQMRGGSWNHTPASAVLLTTDSSLDMEGVELTDFGLRQNDGNDNCKFRAVNCPVNGTLPSTGFYSNRMNAGDTGSVTLQGLTIDGAGGLIIDMPEAAETNAMFMDFSHNTFSNGLITIKDNYSGAGKMMYTNNLLDTITQDVGATTGRRVNTDNITV